MTPSGYVFRVRWSKYSKWEFPKIGPKYIYDTKEEAELARKNHRVSLVGLPKAGVKNAELIPLEEAI